MRGLCLVFLFFALPACRAKPRTPVVQTVTAVAANLSTVTVCAEEDNVNIPLSAGTGVASFFIEATHPVYNPVTYSCAADFTNCPPPTPGYSFIPGSGILANPDPETIVEWVREADWWRPSTFQVLVDGGPPADAHYLRVYRKIAGVNEWPQFFVLYQDGNARLIPHPPVGQTSVCFTSSVIIGPAAQAARPFVEIAWANYDSTLRRLTLTYVLGGSATLDLSQVDRTMARVLVAVNYTTSMIPFATLRSMYISDSNCDGARLEWISALGVLQDDPVMSFPGGEGQEWFLHRPAWSQHNPSGPDLRIRLQ